jgi:hypothetical protein
VCKDGIIRRFTHGYQMQRDFKIGLALGLLLTAAAVLWLSTIPALSTKARLLQSRTPQVSNNKPLPLNPLHIPEQPNLPPEKTAVLETKPRTTSNEQRNIRIHVVRKDETLSDISYNYYGSANNWQKIVTANQSVIKDPNRLTPGAKIIIPD